MRELSKDRLVFATHNEGKLAEMRVLFEPFGVQIVSAKELGLPEPEETEDTFVGNARIKAHSAAKSAGLPALADDSGLMVDALNGAPGVWTADWAETPNGRNFDVAMERAHRELLSVGAEKPWAARFHCTLVLAWPDGYDEVYEGNVEGSLVWPPRGPHGHGYDPMFVPDESELTFAEMTESQKNAISHRSRALAALLDHRFT